MNRTQKLALDIRNGNQKAFELFYRMEFYNLVHFIDSYVHNQTIAEDLAQETLCKLWENRGMINPEGNIRAFVFRIARNKTINSLKEKNLFSDLRNRNIIDADILALEDESLEEKIESLELEELIRNIYTSLPESVKESFSLSRKEGLTNKEIAQKKGLSIKAIEYHINISLRIFRKKIKEYFSL